MKLISVKLSVLFFSILFIFASLFAQAKPSIKKVNIKTSAVCGMCKSKIEGALSNQEGVVKSSLSDKTKIVLVKYDSTKTSPEKIRQAISMAGYDADDVKANADAYNNLEDCCKKN